MRQYKFTVGNFYHFGGPGSGPREGDSHPHAGRPSDFTPQENQALEHIKSLQQKSGFAKIADLGENMDLAPSETHDLLASIRSKSGGNVFTSRIDDPQQETKYDKMYAHPITGNNLVRAE